jgi:hypothetical protein
MKMSEFHQYVAETYNKIVDALNAGKTVYFQTYLNTTMVKKKHLDMIRLRNNAIEIQSGKRWVDYSHCKITIR